MLQALLRGKLSREHERMEDVLTSNVFGLLSYFPPDLFRFLSRATNENGLFPLAWLADAGAKLERIEFWPFWSIADCKPCEPDVAVWISSQTGRRVLLLIEAKYLSGKSSESDDDQRPNDQLAREWDNLVHIARKDQAEPILVYVTPRVGFPRREIFESIGEYTEKRPDGPTPVLLSLSWRQLPDLFSSGVNPAHSDLCRLAERLNLSYFRGFSRHRNPVIEWRFSGRDKSWHWARPSNPIAWSFQP